MAEWVRFEESGVLNNGRYNDYYFAPGVDSGDSVCLSLFYPFPMRGHEKLKLL
jgi:hypothetical protein